VVFPAEGLPNGVFAPGIRKAHRQSLNTLSIVERFPNSKFGFGIASSWTWVPSPLNLSTDILNSQNRYYLSKMAEASVFLPMQDAPIDVLRIILFNTAQISPKALQRIFSASRNAHYRALCLEAAEKVLGDNWPKEMTHAQPGKWKKPNVIRRLWDQNNSYPLWSCESCNMRLCGIRCCGSRQPEMLPTYTGDSYYGCTSCSDFRTDYRGILVITYSFLRIEDRANPEFQGPIPAPSGCGKYLFLDTQTNLMTCSTHHEKYIRMCCPCQRQNGAQGWMKVSIDKEHTVEDYKKAHVGMPPFVADDSPMATCAKCGWSVEGALCAGEGSLLPYRRYTSHIRLILFAFQPNTTKISAYCPEMDSTKGWLALTYGTARKDAVAIYPVEAVTMVARTAALVKRGADLREWILSTTRSVTSHRGIKCELSDIIIHYV
jgi:hypothetical protein